MAVAELILPKNLQIDNEMFADMISPLYPVFVVKEYEQRDDGYDARLYTIDHVDVLTYDPETKMYSHPLKDNLSREEMYKFLVERHRKMNGGGKKNLKRKRKTRNRKKSKKCSCKNCKKK